MVNGGHIRHLHIVLWRAPPDEVVSEIDKDVLEAFFGSEVLAGRDNSNRNRGNKPVGTDGCINDLVLGLKDWDNTAAAELVDGQDWTQVQELMTCCDPLEFEALEQARQEALVQARREREQQRREQREREYACFAETTKQRWRQQEQGREERERQREQERQERARQRHESQLQYELKQRIAAVNYQ